MAMNSPDTAPPPGAQIAKLQLVREMCVRMGCIPLLLAALAGCGKRLGEQGPTAESGGSEIAGDRAMPDLSDTLSEGGTARVSFTTSDGSKVEAKIAIVEAVLFVRSESSNSRVEVRGEGLVLQAVLEGGADKTTEGATDEALGLALAGPNELRAGALEGRRFVVSSSDEYPETLFELENIDPMNVVGGQLIVQKYRSPDDSLVDEWVADGTLELVGIDGMTVQANVSITSGLSVSF